MKNHLKQQKENIEVFSEKVSKWVGSSASLVLHTILFVSAFLLPALGVPFQDVLLVVTTIVSLEAIYLSIFIQMTVNRHAKELELVSEDIEDIQENVEEIQEGVEEIEKDVDEIQRDVDEIQENVEEIQEDVEGIEEDVEEITEETEEQVRVDRVRDEAMLERIEGTLEMLMAEMQELKGNKITKIPEKKKK